MASNWSGRNVRPFLSVVVHLVCSSATTRQKDGLWSLFILIWLRNGNNYIHYRRNTCDNIDISGNTNGSDCVVHLRRVGNGVCFLNRRTQLQSEEICAELVTSFLLPEVQKITMRENGELAKLAEPRHAAGQENERHSHQVKKLCSLFCNPSFIVHWFRGLGLQSWDSLGPKGLAGVRIISLVPTYWRMPWHWILEECALHPWQI